MTLSVAEILAQSSNVGAVTIGLELGAERLRPLGPRRSASAQPTGVSVPGRGAGNRDPGQGLLGLDDGQPADRPGPLGDPDADGRRATRRSPTAASCGRRGWSSSEDGVKTAGRRRQARDQPQGRRASCGRCSRACSPRAAPRRRSACRATRSPARPARRRRSSTAPTRTPSSSPRSSASLPPTDPQLLVAVVVDDPKGDYLRRHRRRPGVRRDRQVRAALPGHSAEPGLTP